MVSDTVAATPRVATRRVSRFSSRPFSSPLAASRNVGRPPVVLEWSSRVIRVGYAEQFQPQHIIELPHDPPLKQFQQLKASNSNGSTTNDEDESHWYHVISPLLRNVMDRLMIDPTTRRVVVVAPQPYMSRSWERAIQVAFWNLGTPAVAIVNVTEVVPLAIGWKRGLVVHVGHEEAQFMAHVDGHPLSFTYQVVPSGYQAAVKNPTKIETQFTDQMEATWLDVNNPNSLVFALLKCLEKSPTDARRDLIANVLVCGDASVLVPDLGHRLALKVKEVLSSSLDASSVAAPSATEPHSDIMTLLPFPTQQLQPLASHIGLVSCAPHRADWLAWVGGSVYTTIWHRHDDQDVHVRWTFSPASATE